MVKGMTYYLLSFGDIIKWITVFYHTYEIHVTHNFGLIFACENAYRRRFVIILLRDFLRAQRPRLYMRYYIVNYAMILLWHQCRFRGFLLIFLKNFHSRTYRVRSFRTLINVVFIILNRQDKNSLLFLHESILKNIHIWKNIWKYVFSYMYVFSNVKMILKIVCSLYLIFLFNILITFSSYFRRSFARNSVLSK